MSENQHELLVVSEEALLSCWVELQVADGKLQRLDAEQIYRWHETGELPSSPKSRELIWKLGEHTAANVSSGQSVLSVGKIIRDFRGAGRYIEKTYNGSRYIIFKGYAGLRSVFTGTRYRADHPKILSMGIGRLGQRHTALAGARLTIVFVGAFRIAEYLLSDQATLTSLIGHLATDVVKFGISAGAGYLVGGAMAAGIATGVISMSFVVGPLLVALVAGVATSILLDFADDHYGLTERLIVQMEQALESMTAFLPDPAYLACKTRAQVANILDEVVEAIVMEAKQLALSELRRLLRPRFFPSWYDVPR